MVQCALLYALRVQGCVHNRIPVRTARACWFQPATRNRWQPSTKSPSTDTVTNRSGALALPTWHATARQSNSRTGGMPPRMLLRTQCASNQLQQGRDVTLDVNPIQPQGVGFERAQWLQVYNTPALDTAVTATFQHHSKAAFHSRKLS